MQGSPAHLPARLVVADGLVESVRAKLGCEATVLATIRGADLEGAQYRHPLSGLGGELERQSPVVVGGDYITTESGTGLVHTAPGHGVEDYQVLGPPLHAGISGFEGVSGGQPSARSCFPQSTWPALSPDLNLGWTIANIDAKPRLA